MKRKHYRKYFWAEESASEPLEWVMLSGIIASATAAVAVVLSHHLHRFMSVLTRIVNIVRLDQLYWW